jgi:hypothetical protein
VQIDPEKAVFINCPFDEGFAKLFEAILFATVCCGFVPRSALESIGGKARIDRIVESLFESRYSIHDLSRSKGEGEEGWARFNMPFELGIAVARRYMTRGTDQQHDWLVLVPSGQQHSKFISDLAGFDPSPHDGTEETVVPKVMGWLVGLPSAVVSTPKVVLDALPGFRSRRERLGIDWRGDVPWKLVLDAAKESVPEL